MTAGGRLQGPVFVLWLLFAAFILYGGTIPFHFNSDHAAIRAKLHSIPLNPFVSPDTGRRLSIPDLVQNVLLFLPFGALGFLSGDKGRRTLTGKIGRVVFVTMLGLVFSSGIEALQLLTTDRVSSLGDVVANTAGGFIGAVLAWQLQTLAARGLGRLRAEGLADIEELRPLAVSAIALAIAYWQPFDVTLEVGSTFAKVRSFQHDPWQFTGLRDEGTSIMLGVFFATTFASYLSVLGESRAAIKTWFMGSAFVVALEGSQILIASRMPALWDAMIGVVGISIGCFVWSASTIILWPRLWLAVMVMATAVSASLQMLSPFEWAPAYHSMGWFPFFGYYQHTTFETLSHVFELMLLYLPLGFFVGKTMSTRGGALVAAVLLTLLIAGPVEYLQGWVVGRYPDITDVSLSVVGGFLGAFVATKM